MSRTAGSVRPPLSSYAIFIPLAEMTGLYTLPYSPRDHAILNSEFSIEPRACSLLPHPGESS